MSPAPNSRTKSREESSETRGQVVLTFMRLVSVAAALREPHQGFQSEKRRTLLRLKLQFSQRTSSVFLLLRL